MCVDAPFYVGHKCLMLGAVSGEGVTLFRRGVGGVTERWHTVRGDGAVIARAMATACELAAEASAAGGWSEAHSLSLNPQKPGQAGHVEPVVLGLNGADGDLGQLEVSSRTDRPGPVRVRVVARPVAVVPTGHGANG